MRTPIPLYQGGGRYKVGQPKDYQPKAEHLIVLRLCLQALLNNKGVPFTPDTLRQAAEKCRLRRDRTLLLELANSEPITMTQRDLNSRAYKLGLLQ